MSARRRGLIVGILAAPLVLLGPSAFGVTWDAEADDDRIVVRGRYLHPPSDGRAESEASPRMVRGAELPGNCLMDGANVRCFDIVVDEPGTDDWRLAIDMPSEPGVDAVAAALASGFRHLPLSSGGIVIQPSGGWTLVNVDTIVMTDPTPHLFEITILGMPVTVRAVPARYSWSFDDGSAPLVTDSPGAPWPHPTVTHTYRSAGSRTISLSTEWTGTFQIAGAGAWHPVSGVAVTTESAPPLDVRTATNRLVVAP